MRPILINIVLFQIGWFACVLSGAVSQPWIGVSIAAAIMFAHIMRADNRQQELFLIVAAMLIGTFWDSLLVWNNWLDYTSGIFVTNIAPYWIIAMWGLFATTLNMSLRWLKHKPVLAAAIGAIAGPLAYYGGQQLGAVKFVDPSMAIISLSIGWAVFTPILLNLSNYFDGYRPAVVRSAL